MITLTLQQVADVVGGQVVGPSAAGRMVTAGTIDSRTATPGSLFVALPGEHVDGHEFVADALRRGAAGAIVREGTAVAEGIEVDDPGDALLGLGGWVRDEVDPAVVAVTGSSGKTTTKDLIRAALAGSRRVVANVGSYNNELGVPLTCCELERDTEVLVAEVGARGVGHISAMAQVLRPDVAVVTNVGAAHLEMFSDLAGVAKAKAELVEALDTSGTAVLNADDELVLAMAGRTGAQVVTYGTAAGADVRATAVELDDRARPSFDVDGVRVTVPLPGAHNVGNALAAIAAARACGIGTAAAAEGLAAAAVSRWRMELVDATGGVRVLNDAYNANPSSMAVAVRTLAAMAAERRRWAVLGHMAELGAGGEQAHADIGRLCAEAGLDGLVVVGPKARSIHDGAAASGFAGILVFAETPEHAVTELGQRLEPGDLVLVKASRSVGLERVAAALVTREDAA